MLNIQISDFYEEIYKDLKIEDKKELLRNMGYKCDIHGNTGTIFKYNHMITLGFEFNGEFLIARAKVGVYEKIHADVELNCSMSLKKMDGFIDSYTVLLNEQSINVLNHIKSELFPELRSYFLAYKYVIKLS
jgi:hypothetical protein